MLIATVTTYTTPLSAVKQEKELTTRSAAQLRRQLTVNRRLHTVTQRILSCLLSAEMAILLS